MELAIYLIGSIVGLVVAAFFIIHWVLGDGIIETRPEVEVDDEHEELIGI